MFNPIDQDLKNRQKRLSDIYDHIAQLQELLKAHEDARLEPSKPDEKVHNAQKVRGYRQEIATKQEEAKILQSEIADIEVARTSSPSQVERPEPTLQGNQISVQPVLRPKPTRPAQSQLTVSNDFTVAGLPSNSAREKILAPGWLLVDQAYLSKFRQELSDAEVLRFFGGHDPGWQEARSTKIPRRAIVQSLEIELKQARQEGGLRVTLLLGAGGEGKSTALRQVICQLVQADQWYVFWNDGIKSSGLVSKLKNLPPQTNKKILIVADNAETVAAEINTAVTVLRHRRNMHFLLCCRDTDWQSTGAMLNWDCSLKKIRLNRLTHKDAETIVRAWSQYGSQGMGLLVGKSIEEATDELFRVAKSDECLKEAFLGAMLRVRTGDDMKGHVTRILRGFNEQQSQSKFKLLDSFAYIAGMHSENQLFLTKQILADVNHCNERELNKKIFEPLGEEIIVTSDRGIFTRHRAIAEAAVEILPQFGINFDLDIYPQLIESAVQLHRDGRFTGDIKLWQIDLPKHFSEKRNHSLATNLARIAYHMEPSPYLITHFAKLLRKANWADQSVKLLESAPLSIGRDRNYYYEWATAEGEIKNYATDAWLCGVALADDTAKQRPTSENARIYLSGLASAFAGLCDQFNNESIYAKALGAAVQLGLSVPGLREDTKAKLIYNQKKAEAIGISKVASEIAFQQLVDGVIAAFQDSEKELPSWVSSANELSFLNLKRLLKITA